MAGRVNKHQKLLNIQISWGSTGLMDAHNLKKCDVPSLRQGKLHAKCEAHCIERPFRHQEPWPKVCDTTKASGSLVR